MKTVIDDERKGLQKLYESIKLNSSRHAVQDDLRGGREFDAAMTELANGCNWNGQHICEDWLARRVWEDDGGRQFCAAATYVFVRTMESRSELKGNIIMCTKQRIAFAITHMNSENSLVEMPWLEANYQIDGSNWIVLPLDGWRAVAKGDEAMWDALERKLLLSSYLNRPDLIAVIGHSLLGAEADRLENVPQEVNRVVSRIRSLHLPTTVLGFWTDEYGSLKSVLDEDECAETERVEALGMHEMLA